MMPLLPREIGTLIVVVLKAKNLPNKRHIGKQAPYCCAYLNEEKRRTKAIKRGGQHPEWDEEFRFTLYEAIEDEPQMNSQPANTPPPLPPKKSRTPKKIKGGNSMRLQCYADDPREPELIGEAIVDLTEVLTKGETDEWFTLMNKDKYAGEVYIELTFWSNEPAPVKRNPSRPLTGNDNYGGPGNFVPANGSSSSLNGSNSHSTPSRISLSSNNHESHLPSTFRESHSRAELYAPPYEQRKTPLDQLANDFGELGVMDPRRRESFPPAQTIRAPSSTGFNSLPSHPHSHDPHTLANGASTFMHDGGTSVTPSPPGIPLGPTSYYPSYESGTTASHPPPPPSRQGHAGPRYSLPASSSGFVSISSPASTSFGTISSYSSESSGFSGQERHPLPIPPSHPQAPAGNLSPHQNGYPSHPPLPPTPGPPVPPLNTSRRITHSFSISQQHTHDQYQYADPHGQGVIFPSQECVPPASGLQTYHTYTPTTPSPPHDYSPALQHVTRGSRPLPQPQTVSNVSRTRHLSMAATPSSSFPQSLHPGSSGGTHFLSGPTYQNIPPPPPLPTQYHPAAHTLSSPQEPQNPGPMSPLPTRPVQPRSNPSPVRPSLPQPPMGYHPVQPAYQPFPQPPPPPPVTSRHGQLPPPLPLLNAPPANHSYFPGPLPRSPHIIDHSNWGQQGSYGQPASTQGDWQ